MRKTLSILALCVLAVAGQAQAPAESTNQFGPPFSTFAAEGDIACVSWGAPQPVRDTTNYLCEAIPHAWVYGFVIGAAHMSSQRLPRIDAYTVDAWMEAYCAPNIPA